LILIITLWKIPFLKNLLPRLDKISWQLFDARVFLQGSKNVALPIILTGSEAKRKK